MASIIVYTKFPNPRLEYTFKLVFSVVLGVEYVITKRADHFKKHTGIRINYSNDEETADMQIIPSGLLNENEIRIQEIQVTKWQGLPVFFQTPSSNFPFDIFSAVFYMVSRYEEYLPFIPDQHGRFKADQSLAFQNGFLRLPIVDLWCNTLAGKLGLNGTCPNIQPDHYRFQLTVDIDSPWIFKNKGFLYTMGALLKELITLRFNKFRQRYLVLLNKLPDPGDNYEFLEETEKKIKNPVRYFTLCRKRDTYDRNLSVGRINFHRLLKHLDRDGTLGIHPSYASAGFAPFMTDEIRYLSHILERKIDTSRQHYLRMSLPVTYRNLVESGITKDYSMGFAAQTGFRAGIARTFPFYDLWNEKETNLEVVPFQVMDRTLLTYLQYTPDDAVKEYIYYSETIKSVGGEFVSLWHNDSLGDWGEWKGWKKVFNKMIELNENK